MKLFKISGMFAALLMLSSCSMFEIDNYDAPEETIRGEVVDVKTGNPVLTDQGSEGIRVRLTELSWGPNVEHNPDFYCRPDALSRIPRYSRVTTTYASTVRLSLL